MDPADFYIYFILCVIGATYFIAFSYRNVKFVLKHKLVCCSTLLLSKI